jgi:Ca-activated chloride channel family protein
MTRSALVAIAFLAFASGTLAQDVRLVPPRLDIASPAERAVELRAVKVAVESSGALAMTTVEMTFFNPNRRVLEGELQFPLLDGQSVVGFALDVDGRMREAVPVEKARAQMAFEDITRARVDPGVLQVTAGNNYKVRVYPIPANGERRVLLRYVETLGRRGNARVYRLPLGYASGLRALSLEMRFTGEMEPVAARGALGALVFQRDGDSWTAVVKGSGTVDGILEVALPESGSPHPLAQLFGDRLYFHAEARVRNTAGPRALPRIVQLAWDASGSMAGHDWRRERALLDAYFASVRDAEVRLVVVRDAAEPAARFRVADGDWSPLRRALETIVYDGGTNLAAVPTDAEAGEVLLFSDGLANFGAGGFARRNVTVYAISSTARAAPAVLRNIAESSAGRYIDLTADAPEAARDKLLKTCSRITALEGDGVHDLVALTPFVSDGRIAIAGVLTARLGEVRVSLVHADGRREVARIAVSAADRDGRLAATTWAAWKIAALEGDFDANRAEVRRLGRAFGLATRETSLVVLERAEDYARYEIEPPVELAEAYTRLLSQARGQREADRHAHVERIVQRFQQKQAWWDREFPKDQRAMPKLEGKPMEFLREAPRPAIRAPASPAAPVPATVASAVAPAPVARALYAAKTSQAEQEPATSTIRLRPWAPDAPYARRMREAGGDRVYRIYLDERPDYVQSSAFFLDAADILIEKGQPDLAVRVLSNLAEMDLENRALLRILGYRLVQAGRTQLAIAAFRKVLELAPEEPQSYRDLGLAYAADKQNQKAVDMLAEVVMRPWDSRFPDIELIALAELNAIAATADARLDTSRVDPRLLRNLPLDLRVVLTWDADNTDIDLWVTDPNGEHADYSHQLTYQGGRMSLDFTGGYGPEEFSLKKAKPGTYKVEANFYGHRQQIVAGATTLQVKLVTGFGTARAQERIVTLRLKSEREVVYVGDFEVGG